MTPKLMIAALRQGSNGSEILNILNAITGGEEQQEVALMYNSTPILEEVEF